MIHEFALDPTLVAQWSDTREFMRYAGQFGLGTNRIMSCVPNAHWRPLVWAAFEKLARALDPPTAQKRRTWLTEFLKRSLESDWARRSCNGDGTWYEVAEREHARRAFHALLVAAGGPPSSSGTLILRDLEFDHEGPAWSPDHGLVPRRPEALAVAVAPLLRCAKWIRIVEPHFDPSAPKWCETISLFAFHAVERKPQSEWPTLELHTCVSRRRRRGCLEEPTQAAERVRASLGALGALLPAQVELVVYFWAERVGDPDFHDRFLLTNVGGLSFGKGFDAIESEHRKDESTGVLPKQVYMALIKRYVPLTKDYEPRGSARVVGRARTPLRR